LIKTIAQVCIVEQSVQIAEPRLPVSSRPPDASCAAATDPAIAAARKSIQQKAPAMTAGAFLSVLYFNYAAAA
jgi:hypothetical protein